MNVLLWASELARAFWHSAGEPKSFPRNLRDAILRSPLEVTIKELPGLTLRHMERYLAAQEVRWVCRGPDRRLRACLTAAQGAGLILLDADDAPAERVVSLAHELA